MRLTQDKEQREKNGKLHERERNVIAQVKGRIEG